ncbi:MAG: class I SAM-dependent methyltransferase [Sandaracinaceae bacterium]
MGEGDRAKWDEKYRAGAGEGLVAPAWLDEVAGELPAGGRALDLAAGRGRIALWLARRGFAVTAVDVSPVGLRAAGAAARGEGLSLATRVLDLEEERLPPGPFDAVTCFRYRQPSLWASARAALAPGGVLVAETATLRNLSRHDKPPAPFLLEPNELLRAAGDLFVAYYREGWLGDYHLARLVARREGR